MRAGSLGKVQSAARHKKKTDQSLIWMIEFPVRFHWYLSDKNLLFRYRITNMKSPGAALPLYRNCPKPL